MSKLTVDELNPTIEVSPCGPVARVSWPIKSHVKGTVWADVDVSSRAALLECSRDPAMSIEVAGDSPNQLTSRGTAQLAASIPRAVKRLVDSTAARVAWAEETGDGPVGLGPLSELEWFRDHVRKTLLERAASCRAEAAELVAKLAKLTAQASRLEARASILEAGESE